VITETLTPPPARLGVTHWTSRLLAARLQTSHVTVAAAWKKYGVRPWRAETFKFSTDPELVAKVTDVIGLYLNPPENAIVLCVDEKSQIQALNRTQKVLPMQPGHAEQRTHDYVRHGTTTLFAALEVATGQVTGICKTRHRHQEFLGFLKHLARAYPERGDGTQIHLVMDNYATHKQPSGRRLTRYAGSARASRWRKPLRRSPKSAVDPQCDQPGQASIETLTTFLEPLWWRLGSARRGHSSGSVTTDSREAKSSAFT
jgi:transposase